MIMNAKGWGAIVVEKLAHDLDVSFSGIAGFSLINLCYTRKFAKPYSVINIATAVAIIPWVHNIAILEKLQSNDQRIWYMQQIIENGWSIALLVMWNLKRSLPTIQEIEVELEKHETLADVKLKKGEEE